MSKWACDRFDHFMALPLVVRMVDKENPKFQSETQFWLQEKKPSPVCLCICQQFDPSFFCMPFPMSPNHINN